MRKPRLYTAQPLDENSRGQLQGQAAHYLSRVLRRGAGDEIRLFNGEGGEYEARIVALGRGTVDLEIQQRIDSDRESPLHTELGLVISRGERMDWAIQKATELGLSALTPLLSEHGEVKLSGERATKKRAHWQRVAVSACEQCGRNRIPGVGEIQALAEWLRAGDADLALVFAAGGSPMLQWRECSPRRLKLLIGPEGGLSATELALAGDAGFETASLGPRILRTETAPVTALALAQSLWGDFQGASV